MALSKATATGFTRAEQKEIDTAKSIWNLFNNKNGGSDSGQKQPSVNWAKHPWSRTFGPPKMNVSAASSSVYTDITGYRGPREDQNRMNDFRHFFEIFGGDNNEYFRDTTIDAIQQIDNVLTTQILPWAVTEKLEWSYHISTTEKTLAEHSGPQTQTSGIGTSDRSMSVKLCEWRKEFEHDSQYFLTEKGRKDMIMKSKELIASFLRRMNRLIISILTNHEEIRRVYQDDFNLQVNIPLEEICARRWARALPIQKGGLPYLAADFMERRKCIRDLGPEGSEPNWMIVPVGTTLMLGTLPEESVFIIAGNKRMEDTLERGDDAKRVLFDNKVKIHEYKEDGLVDPDAVNPNVGTLRRRTSYSGFVHFSPRDACIEPSKYLSHKVGGAVLNMRNNDLLNVTISMLLENSRMFDKKTGKLSNHFWTLKINFNDPKLDIPEAFKKTQMMMFPNQDISLNEGRNTTFYDVAQWVGEEVSADNLCLIVRTILNNKSFNQGLLDDLNDAIALSKELSSGELSPEQIAIWVAAVNQAGIDGDNSITIGNRFGSIDLPLFKEINGVFYIYYVNPHDKQTYSINKNLKSIPWDTTTINDNLLPIKKENIIPKGWGTVGGIFTIADLRSQPVASLGRRFINDEIIARATKATKAFDIFTKLFEKFFPNHLSLVGFTQPFIVGKENKFTKIASVCQNFLCLPAWPFFVRHTRLNTGTFPSQQNQSNNGDDDVSAATTTIGSASSSYTAINKLIRHPPKTVTAYIVGTIPLAIQNERNWRQFITTFESTEIGKLFGGSWTEYYNFMTQKPNLASSQKRVMLGMSLGFHNFVVNDILPSLPQDATIDDVKNAIKTKANGFEDSGVRNELQEKILGQDPIQATPSRRDDLLINSRLYLDLSSFANTIYGGDYFTTVVPQNPMTRSAYLSHDEVENYEIEPSSLETLFFMHEGARTDVRAGKANDNNATRILGTYISSHLVNTVSSAIHKPNLTSDLEYGLLVALATCSNELNVWKSWDARDVYAPLSATFVRPSRVYDVETSILLDNRELGVTWINKKYSNAAVGTAATERWIKVSCILLGVPSIEHPFKVARNDDFLVRGYVCGEDETFFDDEHPFIGTRVIQAASNMVFMMRPESDTPDFTPLSGSWSPATFSEDASKHFGIEFNKPTRGSVPFYELVYRFNPTWLPPPKLFNVVAGFNKDENSSLDQILCRMWCAKYSPATGLYTSVGNITDVFGHEGSYPHCKTERSGGVFKKNVNVTIAPTPNSNY